MKRFLIDFLYIVLGSLGLTAVALPLMYAAGWLASWLAR